MELLKLRAGGPLMNLMIALKRRKRLPNTP